MRPRFTHGVRWAPTITWVRHRGGRTTRMAVVAVIALSTCLATAELPAQASTGVWTFNEEQSPDLGLMCMGTAGGGTNTNAVLWQCTTNTPNQDWQFSGSPLYASIGGSLQPFYHLSNDLGDCLGTSHGDTSDNTDLVAWSCGGMTDEDQYWWADPVGNACGYYALVNYEPMLETGEYYVAGVGDGSIKDGTNLVLFNWQNACNNQAWNGPTFPN
jgi:hypothetical protein